MERVGGSIGKDHRGGGVERSSQEGVSGRGERDQPERGRGSGEK